MSKALRPHYVAKDCIVAHGWCYIGKGAYEMLHEAVTALVEHYNLRTIVFVGGLCCGSRRDAQLYAEELQKENIRFVWLNIGTGGPSFPKGVCPRIRSFNDVPALVEFLKIWETGQKVRHFFKSKEGEEGLGMLRKANHKAVKKNDYNEFGLYNRLIDHLTPVSTLENWPPVEEKERRGEEDSPTFSQLYFPETSK